MTPAPLHTPAALELLGLDVPAHLGTLDPDGFPRITPIWFLWDGEAFLMTSHTRYPQVRNLQRDPRATICIDTESATSVDGIRPNRQIRARGLAEVVPDADGDVTRAITLKYLRGPDGPPRAEIRAAHDRMVLRLTPDPERLIVAV